MRIPSVYHPLYVSVDPSFLSFYFIFFIYGRVRHDDMSAPYFPRVFFAAVVIVYYRHTMLIVKSIFLRVLNASVQQPRHLSNHGVLDTTIKFYIKSLSCESER